MARIRTTIRQRLSARHVPEIILETKEIPYTASGKKVEVAVKRILAGEHIKSRGALANPNSLDLYYNIAQLKQGQCRKRIEQKQSRGIFFKLFLIPARHSRALKLKQQNGDHNNTVLHSICIIHGREFQFFTGRKTKRIRNLYTSPVTRPI